MLVDNTRRVARVAPGTLVRDLAMLPAGRLEIIFQRSKRLRAGAAALAITIVAGSGCKHPQIDSTVSPKPVPVAAALPPPDDQGFVLLFNGRDLTGWDGDPRWWKVVNGAIQGRFPGIVGGTTQAATMLFFRGLLLEDFELHLSFRSEGGAYDVIYRAQPLRNFDGIGYACTLWPNVPGGVHESLPSRTRSLSTQSFRSREEMLADLQARQHSFHPNEWNELVIEAQGNRVRHTLNGLVTVEAADPDQNRRVSGMLALAMHFGNSGQPHGIQVRNIRLKRLPVTPAVSP